MLKLCTSVHRNRYIYVNLSYYFSIRLKDHIQEGTNNPILIFPEGGFLMNFNNILVVPNPKYRHVQRLYSTWLPFLQGYSLSG